MLIYIVKECENAIGTGFKEPLLSKKWEWMDGLDWTRQTQTLTRTTAVLKRAQQTFPLPLSLKQMIKFNPDTNA